LTRVRPHFAARAADAPADGPPEQRRKITFRRLLLNKCQEEFEKGDAAMNVSGGRAQA
jgi:hypothetical protein